MNVCLFTTKLRNFYKDLENRKTKNRSPGGNHDRYGHEPGGRSDLVDRQVKIDDVADAVRGSHRLAYSIIHDHFHFLKGFDGWILIELKAEHIVPSMARSL
jgi:hypothetical protein